jgi:hypothetical protein
MFRAQWAAGAGEGDVETLSTEPAGGSSALQAFERAVDGRFDLLFQFVDALASFALGVFRCGFEPEIIDLGGDAVFAREPAVAEEFVFVLA